MSNQKYNNVDVLIYYDFVSDYKNIYKTANLNKSFKDFLGCYNEIGKQECVGKVSSFHF